MSFEWAINPALETEDLVRHRSESTLLSGPVHGPQDAQQLPSNRRVRLEGDLGEFRFQVYHRAMHRSLQKVGLELLVFLLFDPHMRVPTAVTDGVARKPDRRSAGVPDRGVQDRKS